MGTTSHDARENVLLFICITAGAVIGFSLTGGAAIGTAIGAAAGPALLAHDPRRSGHKPSRRA